MNEAVIERNRQAPRGCISLEDDMLWEAYLQLHTSAEAMGLLDEDTGLHDLLDARIGVFQDKYSNRRTHGLSPQQRSGGW